MRCIDNYAREIACNTISYPFATGSLEWWLALFAIVVACVIAILMWVLPVYSVWASRKSGQADLAEAQFEQQIQIAEAQGRFNAAELNKKAAIVEAEAVAAQITMIGEHLTQHDLYLRWQWIEMMKHRDGETIYVPTEANLPVLEATRRRE